MNEELKQQARKEFRKQFVVKCSDGEVLKDLPPKLALRYIDSLIDRTVQKSEERIVGILQDICDMCSGDLPEHEDIWRFAHNKLSLITKKSDVNK